MKKFLKKLEAFAPVLRYAKQLYFCLLCAGDIIWLYFVACFAFAIIKIIYKYLV